MSGTDGRGSESQRYLYSLLRIIYPNYTVIYEQPIPNLRQRFDLFVLELGIAIEYDGKQHSQYVQHFHRDINGYLQAGMLDRYKNAFASLNGIKVIRVDGFVLDMTPEQLRILIEATSYPEGEYSPACMKECGNRRDLQKKKRNEYYQLIKKKRR